MSIIVCKSALYFKLSRWIFKMILYTYSLVVSGIALLFKPKQELFLEGLFGKVYVEG